MLKKPEVLNFLERNRNYTPASRRDKLRKLLNEHKDNLREMVDEYNFQNPPMQEHRREAEEFMTYGRKKNEQIYRDEFFFIITTLFEYGAISLFIKIYKTIYKAQKKKEKKKLVIFQ